MKKFCHLMVTGFLVFFWLCALPALAAKLELLRQEKNVTYYKTAGGKILVARKQGGNLSSVPNYDWWYGCAPTSTGMMLGYYDINGYQCHAFDNFVPGGTAELSSFGNPSAIANDAIASTGHVADFYTDYGNSGDDPLASGRTIPDDFDCIADFMGSNQDSCFNSDGETTLYFYTDGTPFTPADAVSGGIEDSSGLYGIHEYILYAGYSYTPSSLYNQYIYGLDGNTLGFTFADYKNEIDNGRPVLIHVDGHTMLGFGYLNPNTVYLHDTWTNTNNTMTWGGSYDSMAHFGVTCLEPSGGTEVLDFGDATDPAYPTLLANDGARHRVCSSIYLGSAIDDDADGQPNADATGDDTNGTDDEDGISFATRLNIDSIAIVNITASTAGFLDAWVDFNNDGDWLDAGEQIFSSQALSSGVNALTFTVPGSSSVGTTFARFRFSSTGGLSCTGYAPDGEVEDYEVEIIDADYTVTFIAGSGGSITGDAIQYVYEGDTCAPVTATPASGYDFTGWTGDYVGTDNPLTITNVTADMNITANFKAAPPPDDDDDSSGGGGGGGGCFINSLLPGY